MISGFREFPSIGSEYLPEDAIVSQELKTQQVNS
jgi:hypothetical protein